MGTRGRLEIIKIDVSRCPWTLSLQLASPVVLCLSPHWEEGGTSKRPQYNVSDAQKMFILTESYCAMFTVNILVSSNHFTNSHTYIWELVKWFDVIQLFQSGKILVWSIFILRKINLHRLTRTLVDWTVSVIVILHHQAWWENPTFMSD